MKYVWETRDIYTGRYVKARHYLSNIKEYEYKFEFFLIGKVLGMEGGNYETDWFLIDPSNGRVNSHWSGKLFTREELATVLNKKEARPLHDLDHFVEEFSKYRQNERGMK